MLIYSEPELICDELADFFPCMMFIYYSNLYPEAFIFSWFIVILSDQPHLLSLSF